MYKFCNILVEGVEGEKQCPFHPLCTMNQRIGYPVEGVEREIPNYIRFIQYWNTETRSHRVLNRKLYLFSVSLCLCVLKTTILIGLEELAVLFITTRRFPMKKTAVYEMELDGLLIVHQRFDVMLSTL